MYLLHQNDSIIRPPPNGLHLTNYSIVSYLNKQYVHTTEIKTYSSISALNGFDLLYSKYMDTYVY